MTEYFNVETKVRALVSELIEPVVLRTAEDRTVLDKLKRQTDSDRKRLEELEFALTKAQRKFGLLDEANRRAQEASSNLAVIEAHLEGKIERQAAQFEKSITELRKNDSILQSLGSKTQHQASQIQQLSEVLEKHQNAVLQQYQEVTAHVTATLTQVQQLASQLEDQVAKVIESVTHVRSVLPMHQGRIEVLERGQSDLNKDLARTQREMISEKKLQAIEGQVTFQITSLNKHLAEEAGKRKDIEAFLEQVQPVLTQFQISSALLAAGDRRLTSRYVGYEAALLESMQKEAQAKPSGLNSLRKLSEMRFREMEYRRFELDQGAVQPPSPSEHSPTRADTKHPRVSFSLSMQPIPEPSHKPDPPPVQETKHSLPSVEIPKAAVVEAQTKPERSFITSKSVESVLAPETSLDAMMSSMQEQIDMEDENWVEVKLQEMLEVVPTLQKDCGEALSIARQTAETYALLTKALRSELDVLTKRDKRGSSDLRTDLSAVGSRVGALEQSRMAQDQALTVLRDACRGLAEGLATIQMLLAQDEKDRENIQLTGYRDTTRSGSKPVISLNSDCLSCSGQTHPYLAAFKMACLNYAPSLVRFRGALQPRLQVIDQVGVLIQGVVSTQLGGPRIVEPRGMQDQGTTPRSTRRVRRSLHLSFA